MLQIAISLGLLPLLYLSIKFAAVANALKKSQRYIGEALQIPDYKSVLGFGWEAILPGFLAQFGAMVSFFAIYVMFGIWIAGTVYGLFVLATKLGGQAMFLSKHEDCLRLTFQAVALRAKSHSRRGRGDEATRFLESINEIATRMEVLETLSTPRKVNSNL